MSTINKGIEKRNIQDILPLTPLQAGMLFHYLQNPSSEHYFEQLSLRIRGPLIPETVQKAWNHVIETNEMLRTVFRWEKLAKPVQMIMKVYEVPLKFFDLSYLSDSKQVQQVEEIKKTDQREGIDIRIEPFRVTLIKLNENESEMIISNHHILYDGWSNGIILKEFFEAYQTLMDGLVLKEGQKNSFKEFIKWIQACDQTAEKNYWTNYLKGFDTQTSLPESTALLNKTTGTGCQHFLLNEKTSNNLYQFVSDHRITAATVFYTAWGILLQSYNNTDDVLFGTTVSGRNIAIPQLEEMVGLFINTIPLRVKSDLNEKILPFLQKIDHDLRERTEHEHVPLVDIKSYSAIEHHGSLFDSIVIIENYPLEQQLKANKNQLHIESYSMVESTNFDLTLAVEMNDQLKVQWVYNTLKFGKADIQRLSEHFSNILNFILDHPQAQLTQIKMLSEVERNLLLQEFNNYHLTYPKDQTICHLIEKWAQQIPDQIAVKYLDQQLSYSKLNQKANQLAHFLSDLGLEANQPVGIMAERSLELMIGIMAILKAGGAYLPINTQYPEERIRYMLEDSGAQFLLTHERLQENISFAGQVFALEDEHLYDFPAFNVNQAQGENLAYIIYTSGSTGKPKGVMITHQSLNDFIFNYYDCFERKIDFNDHCLSLSNISFDVSVSEIFLSLAFGATLVFFNNDLIPDVHKLAKMIIDEEITMAFLPPTILNSLHELLVQQKDQLKLNKMMTGVEPILDYVFENYIHLNPEMQILNGYGPTETTICATMYKYQKRTPIGRKVPIGKPLANTQVYILDRNLQLAPIGVIGELCISGDGLAVGYLNKPDVTVEKFVPHPFLSGRRMYKTGDLARWLPDGNIEFIGRIDHQVKIRGYRIEPGEIQCHLMKYEVIQEAVVIPQDDQNGTKYLCAYIVAYREVTVKELRDYLARILPDYMVPSYFSQLEKIPVTANGKTDRRALPEPEGIFGAVTEYQAPENVIQEKLVVIWKEVLGINQIGTMDNFFELGGHSLKATSLVGKIHKELDVEMPINQIFTTPTIKGLSEYIQHTHKRVYSVIERVEEKDNYQTSPAQKRMYMLQQFDLESTRYNMPGVFVVEGAIELSKMKEVFSELIYRHETLRTSFVTLNEEIVQRVHDEIEMEIEIVDEITQILPGEIEELDDNGVEKVIKGFVRPFNLSEPPLIRVALVPYVDNKHLFLFDMHHIISDGTSMSLLIKEFVSLYDGQKLDPLKIQYKDVAAWQNKLLQSDSIKQQKEYWLNQFSDEVPVLSLPTDYRRPLMQSMAGETICFTFNQELKEELKELMQKTGSTMYMVLLSGLNILLAKYSGQEDIVIGSPIAGRQHSDLEKIIGVFINTLAMRNKPMGTKTYQDFLSEVKQRALQAYENQDYQFEDLVEQLNLKRDLSRNPLFDVMFAMQNMAQEELQVQDIKFTPYPYENRIAKFDLTISAMEIGNEIILEMEYCNQLFKRETIERMFVHLQNILRTVAENPIIPIHTIDLLSKEERSQLLFGFNDTQVDYPDDQTIHKLFEEQVEKNPDQVAVVFAGERLSYRELNVRANALAHLLRTKGVKEDTIIGILAEPSLEMIVGIVGILKAGGAYLPLDPEYPKERIKLLLEDCMASILLDQRGLAQKLDLDCEVVDLLETRSDSMLSNNLLNQTNPDSLAYVIYTSGSTGKPKGVMVEHRSVVRLVKNSDYVELKAGDKILQTGTLAFDASTFEIWGGLLNGIEVHLGRKDQILIPEQMEEYLSENQITTLFLTTALFNLFAEERPDMFNNLSYLLTGGEIVSPKHIQKVKRTCKDLKLVHVYGPTENTTFSTSYLIEETDLDLIPIGKPIHNSTAYIFDQYNNLCPMGVYGELCVGGDGLSRGYVNHPALTAEKFVENPLIPGEQIYRTGDLARWLPDGNIDFLSRVDHQVKIRGFRIEPGEIENHLMKYEMIEEAIVIDWSDEQGNKYLCAYLVTTKPVSVKNVKDYLANDLPDYMIPSYFIQLEKMPLTRNGKIDRKALPKPERSMALGVEYVAPRNQVEEQMALIWSEILGVERVGIHDNFFELGGHSLRATILASRIHKTFNVELPLREIFKRPTIKELTAGLVSLEENLYSSIQPVDEQEYYPASSAQVRLYLQYQFEGAGISYNMPWAFMVDGMLNHQRVKEAFQQLVQRHETLRTSFTMIDGKVVQKICEEVIFTVDHLQSTGEELSEIIAKFIRPFDLKAAPLLRIGLVQLAEDQHLLLFDMHHIISDGTTMGILVKEFVSLYQGEELISLPIQYKDFSAWQNELFTTGRIKDQEDYWLRVFAGEIPVLNMPTDYPRPAMQSFVGDRIGFELDQELTEILYAFTKANDVTLYMTLLATYNLLLFKYTGQEEIIVGSPIAGRPHADLQGIMGMFVNTLVMRIYPSKNLTFKELLLQIKETALNAFEYQDYPFERLVDKLDLVRDTSRNPLFDTMFALQNMASSELAIEGLRFRPYPFGNPISKFDLSLFAFETEGKITFDLEYCTKLFKRKSMEGLVEHFTHLLKQVLTDSGQTLATIDLILEKEKRKILQEFNHNLTDNANNQTIHQLFQEQVVKTPDEIAIVLGEERLTYQELDHRSNQLARILRTRIMEVEGTVNDRIVALMIDRSLEMIISILAILKAGAAYLPIDPEYPEERISYMLTDSGASILLTSSELAESISFSGEIIDVYNSVSYHSDVSSLKNINQPKDLLYLIYTSGSTGKPKGAMIEHKNIVNLIQFQSTKTNISFASRVLQFTTISFDVSYQEIFSTLLAGGKLYLIDNQIRKEPDKLLNFIQIHQIEVLFLPTSYFKFIVGDEQYLKRFPESLKHIIVAGEQLIVTKKLEQYLQENEVYLHNHYGPSEAHVVSTYTMEPKVRIPELPPIGKPICNTRLYIGSLDEQRGTIDLVPEKIVGELFIAGDCVGRGYHNRPELTAEKFLVDPFVPGKRLYRTGDLARWLPDGNVEFMGRVDHQVKIRGYRVEIGEIENHLLKHEAVKEVIVVVEGEEVSKNLCAYLVAEWDLTASELREYLASELPEYMIPAYFIQLATMPLTPNGKIDRRALPEPEGGMQTGVEYLAPTNDLEERLVTIWQDVLGVEEIGLKHSFFELGGHSLKATIMISKIHEKLNVEVPLREIFARPTIQALAEYIEAMEENLYAPIQSVAELDYYPASSAQKRLYLQNQFEGTGISYNMPGVLEVDGYLDIAKVEEIFIELITRHETFRTFFDLIDGTVVQTIVRSAEFTLNRIQGNDDQIPQIVTEFVRPFDLRKAPLLRVGVVELAEHKYLLIFDMHHIISDGTSMGILVKEFVSLYEGKELPPLVIQYKDYAVWQNERFKSERIKKQEVYWRTTFEGEIPVLNLPTDYPRPSIQSFEGRVFTFTVDRELTEKLNILANQTNTTLYMVLLGCFNLLLSKYSGQEDIIVGSPVAGRNHADLQRLIGMFVNTIAIRNHPVAHKTFSEFLQDVKESTLKAHENQDYPFEELVELLDVRRDLSRNPLFDVTFVMQNMDQGELKIDKLIFNPYQFEQRVAKFDLTLSANEVDEEISFTLEYSSKLFKPETIERMISHLRNIFNVVVADPQIQLGAIEMISLEEKEQILSDFNLTQVEYPRNKTVHQLFAEQVQRTPNQIAVVFAEQRLTYQELDEKANSLATLLIEKGIQKDQIVGIVTERSLEIAIGFLAILKAGGAYLPIDLEYPASRIQLMLDDCSVQVVLTSGNWPDQIEHPCDLIDLTNEILYQVQEDRSSKMKDSTQNSPDSLAYVIYTSGSTGRPKGVMVEHRNVVRLVKNSNYIQFTNGDKILQTGSMAFDVSTFEIWGALLNGLEFHLGVKDLILTPEEMENYIVSNQITILWLTTPLFNLLADARPKMFRTLKNILVGGDALSPKHVNKVRRACPNLQFTNGYGPTENTTFSTCFLIDQEYSTNIPIGTPISNSTAYIFDQNNLLVPIGVYGELCVGGDGLARGYLDNPTLTAEKFVENPYRVGERMYRTGDLVRWLPDGNIEFNGRIDHQVKIRGFRIELGEIESRLLENNQINEVVVIDRQDVDGNKYLVAYLVADRELLVGEIRAYLAKELPDYMIPSYFIQLEQMPLNQNGKVNRKALPEPEGNIATGVGYKAPRNKMEEKLTIIWEEVLGLNRVGIQENFFDLGGHSLKATTLATQIHKEFNVELPLQEFFHRPTIKELAEFIAGADESLYASIQPAAEQDDYPASAAQKRLYIQNEFAGVGVSYNMPGAVIVEGSLDREKIEQVFIELIQRHETLRTSFMMRDGEVVQKVLPDVAFTVDYYESSQSRERGENLSEDVLKIISEFIRPFDLSEAPLLRVGLVKLTDQRHLMVFDLHHIIGDGVSMENLIREFSAFYQGVELLEMKIQYKDFAVWQNEIFQSEIIEKQEKYWLDSLAGEIPVLNLPTDYPRPPIQSFKGDRFDGEIDSELMGRLKALQVETGTTLYMVLLAAYNVLLYKYTGQEDLIIGSPIAGRRHADLQQIIGMFVNMLPLRNRPTSNKTFKDFLSEVKENTLQAFDNQDYQFEELVEKLQLQRNLSRNPLFDVIFSLQDATQRSVIGTDELHFVPYNLESNVAKYDLTLEIIEEADQMLFSLEYCSDLFSLEIMKRFAGHFLNLLRGITSNPDVKLSELDILSEVERRQILEEFNATEMEFAEDQTLHQLFELQVAQTPERIALVEGDQRLTYSELNFRANHLAHHLRELGVGRDEIVAIMAQRSIEMLVGIMGILKASGAYMPIDPDYPLERIKYMLGDSKSRILLTDQKSFLGQKEDLMQYNGIVIDLKDLVMNMETGEFSRNLPSLPNINQPDDLAYVMYTSGSTGKPKGVMIEHRGVVSLSQYYNEMFKLNQEKHILHMSNVSFDTSVVEIFPPLIYGGTVFVIGKELALNREKFIEYVWENQIHFAQFVPMTLQEILGKSEKPESLETVIVGGDKLDDQTKDQILALGYNLTNHYGPTEATVDAIVARCEQGKSTIGQPIANAKVYILDKDNNLAPVGVPGELCISGIGLARGYLNRPDLTAERFISHPLVPDGKIYRTGDVACWQLDGNITFLGRIDNQVKIRGYRIELGEIEQQLLNNQDVTGAVVIDRIDSNNNKYLCGYIVANREMTVTELREHLMQELPEYMVPAHFIQIERIPLTHNRKVDRQALPEPDGVIQTETEYAAPTSKIEEKLIIIWQDVLGVEKIGINHNFFEMGGHSLKAIQIVNLIHQEFHVQIGLQDIFASSSIKELSQLVQSKGSSTFSNIQALAEQEYYELSYNQKRLWIISQLETNSRAYNLPGRITLDEEVDEKLVINTINHLVNRHESLRTQFTSVDGETVQVITSIDSIQLEIFDLKNISEEERSIQREMIFEKIINEHFIMVESPLLRVALVKLTQNQFDLIFCMHHIISDGWSMEILEKEFHLLYSAYKIGQVEKLAPLTIQYKDFASWQNRMITDPVNSQQAREYWLNKFNNGFPVLNLPQNYSSTEDRKSAGYRIVLSEEMKNQLKEIANQQNTSLFMVMVTALKMFLADLTGQEDVAIGVPSSGRQHQNLMNVIGFFINTIVLINRVNPEHSFDEMLETIQQDSLKALEYQDYPLELITDELKMQYPRIQVFFNMLNMGENQRKTIENEEAYHISQVQDVKFDIMFYLTEYSNGIEVICTYLTGLYKPETIEYIVGEYIGLISKVLGNDEQIWEDDFADEGDDLILIRG